MKKGGNMMEPQGTIDRLVNINTAQAEMISRLEKILIVAAMALNQLKQHPSAEYAGQAYDKIVEELKSTGLISLLFSPTSR
jgi:hypothetical protein